MAHIPNGFSVPMMTYPVITQLGLLNTHNYTSYIQSYPEIVRDSYIMKAEANGAIKATKTKKWKQWVDDNKPLPSFKVTANASGAAGAAVTVTLTSGSHEASGALSPVAVGQVWEDDLNGIQYEVRSVNKTVSGAHTASIAPTKTTQSAAITATTSFFKFQGMNSTKEASSQRDGIYRGFKSRDLDLQIIRTDKKYSDLSSFEVLEYKGETYRQLDDPNLDKDHMMSNELTLMFGDQKNNMTDAAGNMNTDARGLIPMIKAYGTDLTATTALSDSFFKDLTRMNDADGFTDVYDVLADSEFYLAYQDYLSAKANTTNTIANVSVNERDKQINGVFDFSETVKIYGTQISVKKYAYFNSSRTHGADIGTGIWRGSAIFLPIGTKYSEAAEGDLPYFRVRYFPTENGSINAFDTDGALFGKNTTRVAEVSLTCYKGMEMNNALAFKFAKISV